MIFLGFGKYARADKIYALEPIETDRPRQRPADARVGRGRRRADRRLAHRADDPARDGAGRGASSAILDDALALAERLAEAAEQGQGRPRRPRPPRAPAAREDGAGPARPRSSSSTGRVRRTAARRRAPDRRPAGAVPAAAPAGDRHPAAARVARLPAALVRPGDLRVRQHGDVRRGPVPALPADRVGAPGRAALDLRRGAAAALRRGRRDDRRPARPAEGRALVRSSG